RRTSEDLARADSAPSPARVAAAYPGTAATSWPKVSVQGRLPMRRHGGVLCSRSPWAIALEMALRLICLPRRNRSVRFDQFEVAEAARPARRGLWAQALVEYRPGGLDSFATPVALVQVVLDRHLASPSAAAARKLPVRDVCPIPGNAKR